MPLILKNTPPYYTTTALETQTTLTDAQIKTLPTTGIDIIPTPTNNKLIIITTAILLWNTSAGAYTNVDPSANIVLTYGDFDETATSNSGMHTDAANRITILSQAVMDDFRAAWAGYSISYINGTLQTPIINKKISLWATNGALGNFTGGNAANTLKVIVKHFTINL